MASAIYLLFVRTPTAFIPTEDQGVLSADIQLRNAASLPRTQAVLDRVGKIVRATDGVADVVTVSGYGILTGATKPSSGMVLVELKPWVERKTPQTGLGGVYASLVQALAQISTANIVVVPPFRLTVP